MNELAARLRAVPEGDLSIAVGAAALAIGSFVAFDRLTGSWANFPLFLLLAIPAAMLLAMGLAFAREGGRIGARADGRLAPWQTVCLLTGIPLLLLSILQLLVVLGKDDPGTGTATWVFLLTGALALWLSTRSESPGLVLLAGLFFGIAGLTAVNWIDSDASLAAYRDVLLIEGALYLLAARQLWRERRATANLLVGLAGIALIAGAVLGKLGDLDTSFGFFSVLGSVSEGGDGWELVLIVVTIGLLAYSAWQRHGGLAVIGTIGAFAFFSSAILEGDLWGWPVLLFLLAVGCFAWALIVRPQRQDPGAGANPHASQPSSSVTPPPAPPAPPPAST